MIRVLIVNDQTTLRKSLIRDIASLGNCDLVANITAENTAPHQAQETRPDLVFVAISSPANRGMETVAILRNAGVTAPIVCVVDRLDPALLENSLRNRVNGLISEFSTLDEVAESINRVASGDVFVSPMLIMGDCGPRVARQSPTENRELQHLTYREQEIVAMVAAGKSAADIADRLGISGSTVYFHRRNIAGKIGLRQTADITRFAVRAGLVTAH